MPADHEFLATERRLTQADWSVDVANIPLGGVEPTPSLEVSSKDGADSQLHPEHVSHRELQQWLESSCWYVGVLRRDSDAYFDAVMASVTDALVQLLLALPLTTESELQSPSTAPVLWLIAYLRDTAASTSTSEAKHSQARASAQLTLFFKTNYELMRTVDTLKHQQREMHAQLDQLREAHAQLNFELQMRDRFVAKLSTSTATTRTAVIMVGMPFELNAQRNWVPPNQLLVPEDLSNAELIGLRRAERVLMEQDERRWKTLLRAQLEYDASTAIQRIRRGFVARRAFLNEMRARTQAATIIQRNYFHYLYHRAICLPRWCLVGREVLVSPSVAQKCAISFQFYARKDFPAGNFRRLESVSSVVTLMAECREDERCAGFSTDGSLKRFVPRQLSQLKPMAEAVITASVVHPPGLYIKVLPPRDDPSIVNTAIITATPPDRFGLVEIAMDGLGITEHVPVTKLSDRWKRIRVMRKRDPRRPRAVVFGRAAKHQQSHEEEIVRLDNNLDIERVVDDDDDDEHGHIGSSNDTSSGDGLELAFQDQATREIVVIAEADAGSVHTKPPRVFEDDLEREREIVARRRAFETRRDAEYAAKVLASAIRLQCAWRSKRARENLHKLLLLRVKEKEREQLVARARVDNNATNRGKGTSKTKQGGLFGRWRKGN
jgi:hypothetical protein